ncbi:uncharacterized protein Pyn_31347 [Prunus yedoensis var. nudiflora]|uniref:Uncharacterized protein n=1 Tax=Prunus yedoensis var. nudiflora TaxID=2094558 RepID=A0A314YMN4_PRUYE|nr:uncharacterized protein Pyn_31347 [Prunus yedoensis var. nudiflora]
MEASSPSAPSRKRKTKQNPIVMPQIVLALAAPNINPNAIQRTVSSTKPQRNCSGLGLTPPSQHPGHHNQRRKQEAAAQQEHEHQLHSPTTTNNNATKRTVSSTKIQSNYSLRPTARGSRKIKQEAAAPQEQEHEEKKGRLKMIRIRVLDPDATESSTDTGETNAAVNEQPKRKKVEIVHEIQMLEENTRSCPRKLETQEISNKKESKKKKKICLSSRSSSPSCSDEGREDEEILKGSSITSSNVQMAARKLVLYDVPGPIPDLEEFLKLDYDLQFLLTFFDDLPDDLDCEDY